MSKPRTSREREILQESTGRQSRLRCEIRHLGARNALDLRRIASDRRYDEESRAQACRLLAQLRDRTAAKTLLRIATTDNHETVRWEAFSALGIIGNREVTRRLLELLERTTDKSTRRQILYALWFLADRRAAPMLLTILNDANEDDGARGFAAEGLGSLRPTGDILQALGNALNDPSVNVRMSALCALSAAHWVTQQDDLRELLESEVIPAIKRRLNDHTACPGEETVAELAHTVLQNWKVAIGPEGNDCIT